MSRTTSAADVTRGTFIAAAILASSGQPMPSEIEQLIHFADCFDYNPEFCEFLRALKAASSDETIPAHLEIAKHVSADNAAWLEIMASSHNPISLKQAAVEAEPLLEKCRNRRIIGVLAEAWQEAKDNPDRAGSIALHACDALKFLGDERRRVNLLTVWRPSQFLDWTEPPGNHLLLPA